VDIADILAQLSGRTIKRAGLPDISPETLGPIVNGGNDPITAEALYPRWANFFRPDNVIITDTGTSSLGLAFAQLPGARSFTTKPSGPQTDGPPRRLLAPRSVLRIAG
jgi:indolepyruvate decarboxylase